MYTRACLTDHQLGAVVPHGDIERVRLRLHDPFLGDMMTATLRSAGVEPGMRVLDVGCGHGDVAVLAASMVGPTGHVVGVDRDGAALQRARRRIGSGGPANVTFVERDFRELELDDEFDAVVGRFVLMYLGDPVEAIGRVLPLVRRGGIVAFQEWTVGDTFLSSPHCPEWHRVTDVLVDTLRNLGARLDMGLGLHADFLAAGLPAPQLRAERPAGAGVTFAGYQYVADALRHVLPACERLGIAAADDLRLDDLPRRLREEAVCRRAAVAFPTIVSAWSRRP